MPEKKKAETLEEAAAMMHLPHVSIPSDADPSAPVMKQDKPAETIPPDTSVIPEEAEADQLTTPENIASEEEPKSEEISPEEKKRRSFQAEAERAKSELKKMQEATEANRRELELERQKNQALMNMLAGVGSLRGEESKPKPVIKPNDDKEPQLADFINLDDYDTSEAYDPRTVSGQAYQKWIDARADWRAEKKFIEQKRREQEENARDLTVKQAKNLAESYPEFKNPFTGEPDYGKINSWLETLGKTDWVTLKRALDGKPVSNGSPVAIPKPESAEAAIGKRASKPDSVVARPAEAPPAPAKISPEVKKIHELFGGRIVLPVDAE